MRQRGKGCNAEMGNAAMRQCGKGGNAMHQWGKSATGDLRQ
jgi:hypothetical protein